MNWDILKKYNVVEYKSPEQAPFDTQIVVTKELERETHRTMRVLSKQVKEEDVRAFVEKAVQMTGIGTINSCRDSIARPYHTGR